jgi:hypothetical protein
MNIPKFSTNSLVTYQDGIYQISNISSKGPGYHYKLILVAYQRDMKSDEFHKFTITPKEIDLEESLLSEFKGKVPRFKFGEGVRVRGEINCIIKFIKYINYNYYYSVREKVHWSDELQSGWEVEEGYLQKW